MTGDFMQDWFTLLLAAAVGTAPFSMAIGVTKLIFGKDETPPVWWIVVVFLMLIVAPFLGYWWFITFAVAWRP